MPGARALCTGPMARAGNRCGCPDCLGTPPTGLPKEEAMKITDFITGLAWIIGFLAAAGLYSSMAAKDYDIAAKCLAVGIIPWAWLIGRYLVS